MTQSDLVQYQVERGDGDRYPVIAIGNAIIGFQELVTSVFDALRSAPKQRYRPSPDNLELSSLDLAMALPVGSVLVSMSIENDRLIAVKSDLDQTFERVYEILKTREPEGLRTLAEQVGIASISKAHDWAANTAQYGLNTEISIQKGGERETLDIRISNTEAQTLKEVIEEKSDRAIDHEEVIAELVGIDVDQDQNKSYFHLKTVDGRNIEGKLAEPFNREPHWAVHTNYHAHIIRVTTIKYSTGEEKVDWLLAGLTPYSEQLPGPTSA